MKLASPFAGGFPLLAKELVEQAVRRRTYVIRCVYAILLFICFAIAFLNLPGVRYGFVDIRMILGAGKEIFEALVYLQFAGIFLFLPAMMSGVLTSEKERDSLGLLILTDLRPWEILLQKYISRLIPMLTLLLLSLPLFAFAYSLGGISSDRLIQGVSLLCLVCFQVGSVSIMCSAYCATTIGAFFVTYAVCGLLYLLPLLPIIVIKLVIALIPESLLRLLHEPTFDTVSAFTFPPYVFATQQTCFVGGIIMIALSCVFFLVMARIFIIRRAAARPILLLFRLFKRIDAFWEEANEFVGGVMIMKKASGLPHDWPIAWRETTRKALGQPHHLVRILVLLLGVVAFCTVCLLRMSPNWWGYYRNEDIGMFSMLVFGMWALAVLAVVVQSANLVASERSSQTLDILLTIPLDGKEMLIQKARGVYRLMMVLAIPLVTLFLLETWLEGWNLVYLFCSLLTLVYLPLFFWLSLWIGLKTRTRGRATLAALAVAIAWLGLGVVMEFLALVCPPQTGLAVRFPPDFGIPTGVCGESIAICVFIVCAVVWAVLRWRYKCDKGTAIFILLFTVPVAVVLTLSFVLFVAVVIGRQGDAALFLSLSFLSPSGIVVFYEFYNDMLRSFPFLFYFNCLAVCYLAACAALWWFLRWWCLRNADWYLGRLPTTEAALRLSCREERERGR